ncbi:MAG TPA: RNA-protein complex protein Nop10 [Thermoplasmata archaeon]|nr:RNA-protein complex protein Nop10 [Thermoplasmata archaeon]HEV2429211.1 RNA-protein complex protein Nop10 [Thermoplasmata archaeon]
MTETHLKVCRDCSRYTLRPTCPACGSATRSPHPARFSPEDRWAKYRRALFADARAAPGAG